LVVTYFYHSETVKHINCPSALTCFCLLWYVSPYFV